MKATLISPSNASSLCAEITADLPEYFGLPIANQAYFEGVKTRDNFAVENIGLISIDFPYPNNANIYWMGVKKQHHGSGIGKLLIKTAIDFAQSKGAETITVETLSPYSGDASYLKTYRFYESLDFKPLFNLKPEGYEWEMVYMVKVLK